MTSRPRLAVATVLYIVGSITVAAGLAKSLGVHRRALIGLMGFVVAGAGLRFAVDG